MDLEALRTFLAVVETGSIRAAADRRHRSQPALSRQIKLFEEDLGARLFARAGRGLPGVPLRVVSGGSEEIVEKVVSGEVDIGVVTLPSRRAGLVVRPAWED